ncbi:MaoC/PaaZ C-terminal domain-containing protein [Ciceribacter azotifigens]|uniref:MaoC/PaaZ C-terminal domain-containing protein n=1 Tax=Ciceribacter azotifigens TaxID=2069303 RepID=UPI003A8A6415
MQSKSKITTVERAPLSMSDFRSLIGTTIGVSTSYRIGQDKIDAFADLTEDAQYIHVDIERAKAGPFGGTIAHGMLSLSIISTMFFEVVPPLKGCERPANAFSGVERSKL